MKLGNKDEDPASVVHAEPEHPKSSDPVGNPNGNMHEHMLQQPTWRNDVQDIG